MAAVPSGTLAFPSSGEGNGQPERDARAPWLPFVCGKGRAVKHISKCQCRHQVLPSDHAPHSIGAEEGGVEGFFVTEISGQWLFFFFLLLFFNVKV